jgi:hypothetical protein
MKLRIRTGEGLTLKVEVGQSETIGALQERVGQACGQTFWPDIVLSLNKKVFPILVVTLKFMQLLIASVAHLPLSGDLRGPDSSSSSTANFSVLMQAPLEGHLETPLSSAGVTSGDLLFLLRRGEDQVSISPQRSPACGQEFWDEASLTRAQALEPLQRPPEPTPPLEPALATFSGACSYEPEAQRRDSGDQEEARNIDEDMGLELSPDTLQIPSYLKRVCSTAGDLIENPAAALVLAVHAALLESGFVPDWTVSLSQNLFLPENHRLAPVQKTKNRAGEKLLLHTLTLCCNLAREMRMRQPPSIPCLADGA